MRRPDQNTKRSLLANSAYIFLIRFFPALATYLAMILLLRNSDRSFNGIYQQFWVQWQVYNVIACLGIPAVLITWPLDRINRLVNGIQAKFSLVLIIWLVLISLVFGAAQFPGYTFFYFLFSCAFLLISAMITILESYLINARKYELVVTCSTFYAIVFALVHWLFIHRYIDVHDLFLYIFAASLVRFFPLLIGVITYYRNNFSREEWPPLPLSSVRSLWFHLGLYDVLQTVFRWADKFVLSAVLSSEVFAVYCAGTYEVPFLGLLLGAVGSALLMRLNSNETTDEERGHILRDSAGKLSEVVFPIFFFMVLFRKEIFEVVFTNRYAEAVPLFLISCMIIPLRTYNCTAVLQNKGKGRIINIGAVGDLVIAFLLMYPLHLLWGLEGVALSVVISSYLQAWFYLYHTAKLLGCRIGDLLPLRTWLKRGVILCIAFMALYYTLDYLFNPCYVLLLGCIVTGIMIGMTIVPTILKRKLNGYQTKKY